MLSLLGTSIHTILMAEFVLGSFANSFIVLVICTGWVKRRKIPFADRILTALAVSRIVLLWLLLVNWHLIAFNPVAHRLKLRAINIAWTIANHISLWLGTCLSIFYLLKVANFSNFIFLHLKWRAERLVLLVLLGSTGCLVLQLVFVITADNMGADASEGNVTLPMELSDGMQLSLQVVFTLTAFVPFTSTLASCLLLIFSLGRHLKKMQLNGTGSRDPSTKAHIKALQTVVSSLLLFTIYSLSLITSTWGSNRLQNNPIFMLCLATGIIYPSNHSIILILVNQKLRQAFLKFPWQLRCWLKEKKPPFP